MAGITVSGFQRRTLAEIVQRLQARTVDVFQPLYPAGDVVDVSPQSVLGQQIGVFAQDVADLWEVAEDVYLAMYRDSAEGVPLEQACKLVGVDKLPPGPSIVPLSLSGDQGAVVPAGSLVRNASGQFATVADLEITSASADRVRLVVVVAVIGDSYTVTIDGTPYTVTAITPSTADVAQLFVDAINGGSTTATAALSSDGASSFDTFAVNAPISVVPGTSVSIIDRASAIQGTATANGPTDVTIGSVTTIVTPVSGWTAVVNRREGIAGVLIESDTSLRARCKEAIRGAGGGSAKFIEARLPRDVPGITSVRVYQNLTDGVVDGRPAHTFETVVEGGDQLAIAEALWSYKGLGVKTYGNVAQTIADAAGNPQTINFSRPSKLYIWVKVAITAYDASATFPTDGAEQIADAIAAAGNQLAAGRLIVVQALDKAIYGVPGIATSTTQIGHSSDPATPPGAYSSANYQLGVTQQPKFDVSRVAVTV